MPYRGFCCLVAFVCLLCCKSSDRKNAPASHAKPALKPLNLLLVTVDTLRADHLQCYGYARIETPAIDGLARKGTLFENAVAQAPLTAPSHASIFTGQNPNVHGIRNTGAFVLPASTTTLAKILEQQGWETAAFVGAAVLKKAFGLNQGFAFYDDEMPKTARVLQYGEHAERPAAQVVDRAVRWLNGQSGKPFFLWVHVFDPHAPYAPPAPYRQQYAQRPYDGEIAYTDHELGRLFQAVARKIPPDKVITVVMADHGESLGEHGEFGHGVFLYDATLRIPLIMVGPGIPSGRRVKEQARTIDVLPTILTLMGVTLPPGVQGISLAPTFSGEQLPAAASYAETLYPKMNMGWSELRAVRTNHWKYIQAPKPELYDLSQDAGETKNVIMDRPGETQQLQAQLRLVAGMDRGPEKVQTSIADRRTIEQLKSLGYLSGFSPHQFELTGKGIDPKDRVEVLRLEHLAVGMEVEPPPLRKIELLRKAVALDPTNPSMYSHLGVAYAAAGRYEDALKLYLRAIQQGVPSPKLDGRIAEMYLRMGNKDEAIAYYEKAASIDPTDVQAQNNLAMAYIEKARAGDAERVFRRILTIDERNADAYNGLGIIAIQKQDLAEGRLDFERAVEFNPDLLEAQVNLGLIYKKAGDRARARACFEAFLAKASRAQYGHIIPRIERELSLLR
jgi:arylsulfatase A-like enzyme/Flp pilus assembly protein TadD